jgi:hypothetical protein
MIEDNATQTTKGLKDVQEKIEEEDLIAEAVWLAEELPIEGAVRRTGTVSNVETYLEDKRRWQLNRARQIRPPQTPSGWHLNSGIRS